MVPVAIQQETSSSRASDPSTHTHTSIHTYHCSHTFGSCHCHNTQNCCKSLPPVEQSFPPPHEEPSPHSHFPLHLFSTSPIRSPITMSQSDAKATARKAEAKVDGLLSSNNSFISEWLSSATKYSIHQQLWRITNIESSYLFFHRLGPRSWCRSRSICSEG